MPQSDKKREAFEAWLQAFDGVADLTPSCDRPREYEDFDTQRAWAAWQAASAAPSADSPSKLAQVLDEARGSETYRKESESLGRDALMERVESYFKRVRKLGGETGECSAAGIADWLLWQKDTKNFAATATLSSARSPEPQSTYVPLTRAQIEDWREVLAKKYGALSAAASSPDLGLRLALAHTDVDTLCDMAINSLLYAQEIDRLRSALSAKLSQEPAAWLEINKDGDAIGVSLEKDPDSPFRWAPVYRRAEGRGASG